MPKRIEKKLIKKLIFLRKKGASVPEISTMLKIPKTTVFNYARNIKMEPEVLEEWKSKRGGGRRLKLLKEERFLKQAKRTVGKLTEKEKLLFISALYWAEGNKKDFMLSNTDPDLVKVYVDGMRSLFKIGNERFKVSVRIYEDMDKNKVLHFWSRLIGLPIEDFQNVYILKGKKQGKLEFGMCRVRITKGGDYLKQLKAINKIVANS